MNWFAKRRVFLDYASATPVLPEVKQSMDKYWSDNFYNPSAIYEEGLLVKKEIGEYRARVARALGTRAEDIIFTGSGTESDNLAILGALEASKKVFNKPHLIVSSIEHPAVTSLVEEVERRGVEVSILDVNEDGLVSIEELKKLLKKNTFLVSVALANHEIGTVQPIAKIGRLLRKVRKEKESVYPLLHTDASQAPNFLAVTVENLQADMITIDGAKIYGPKGIGVLAIRNGVKIHPLIFGGGQERGLRAGTLNPALVSGMALALETAQKGREKEFQRLEGLRIYFTRLIKKDLPIALFNGSEESHLPSIVSVSVPGILSEFVLLKLDEEGVMASVGSACSLDGKVSGSPVIRALGKPELAESTIRFSFGRMTTKQEVKKAAEIFCRICQSVLK